MTPAVLASAPHAHDDSSVGKVMLTVVAAAAPATAWGLWMFGWPAFNLLMVTIGSTLLFEAISLMLAGRDIWRHLGDGSALLAGWLLAMTLPPWAPWWIGALGGALAMLLGKHAYGGLGQNVFNPAMVARVMLLLAFPVQMTTWPELLTQGPRVDPALALSVTFGGTIPDALTGATLLGQAQAAVDTSPASLFSDWRASALGYRLGSMGETSALLLALGGVYMLLRRVISWHIPVAVLASIAIMSALAHWAAPAQQLNTAAHLLSGGTMMAAFFIATDPASSPSTPLGKLVFGVGVGALIFVIRAWGTLPEGVGFAVLTMNAFAPLIDRNTKPRVYGRNRRGKPLSYSSREAA